MLILSWYCFINVDVTSKDRGGGGLTARGGGGGAVNTGVGVNGSEGE